ncbi:MAG: peptide chain release factor 2, partial [Candidatus Falkowbacteria bacterium]|nr:peptide chain release factor 2 [Candidatus Falkowbacteria bacterium]
MENLLKQIEELREVVLKTHTTLDIDGKASEAREIKIEINKPNFWDNREKAIELSRKSEELDKEVNTWNNLIRDIRNLEEFVALADNEGDESIAEESQKNFEELTQKYKELEFALLFSGEYDDSNCILSVHAGSGGVDAQDWAEILERMYLRYAEKKGFKVELLDRLVANEAGIKNSTFEIKGHFAYGYLKSEAGVHRLVRISPFDSEGMRHTSFALIDVLPVLPEAVNLVINEGDLRIDVFRSSGPGGQSVNTTDSAVRIVHIPTNITVSCQTERSQHQNKETALKILKAKLYKLEEEKRLTAETE